MQYSPDLEKRVQRGKDDTDPQHDVMKLAIDKVNAKGKYLYFVPRPDGKYEFCSNDPLIQALIQQYGTQALNKRNQCFRVLDRVKSDLGITNSQAQSPVQQSNTVPQVPFTQSRLAKALRESGRQDLQALNQLCQKEGYDLLWQEPSTYTAPHSNPYFKGSLILRDKKSGKAYIFTSEICESKKGIQRSICTQLFNGARSNSTTLGEPTKEQKATIDRVLKGEDERKQQERAKIVAEQNRYREQQSIFEIKKQQLIDNLEQNKIDTEAFKEFRDAFSKITGAGSPTQFYSVLDDIIEKHPEVAETLTKTVIATYGFSLKGGRKERSDKNSESENFFIGHQDCLKYVQKEFDAFVEPYKKDIAQWKALDELAPTIDFNLDVNDGRYTYRGSFHTINQEDIEKKGAPFGVLMVLGDDWHPVNQSLGEKTWNELDVIRDINGEKIDESRNKDINRQIARVYGVNLYEEAIPTPEQRKYAQELIDKYMEIKNQEKQKQANQEKIRALKEKQLQTFMSENSVSAEMPKEDIAQAINNMRVVASDDNSDQVGFNRKYTFTNERGNEYDLVIIDNQDKTLSVEFGPFSFSAKLASSKENYDPNDGSLNKLFEHELKRAVYNSRSDAVIIDAALRKVGIIGHPNTIQKKIKQGELHKVQFKEKN